MMQGHLFEPILKIVIETMPRDNLLNSACLEFFEFIRKEDVRPLISHLVENYREKIKDITYVDIFSNFILRYDQTEGFAPSMGESFPDTEVGSPKRPETGRGSRWDSGIKDLDAAEEEYFNTSDDEDDAGGTNQAQTNGASTSKPLVDYPSDEENEMMEGDMSAGILPSNPDTPESSASKDTENEEPILTPTSSTAATPPEKLSEKRRREEDEDDDLGKLAQNKRRNSNSSVTSNAGSILRRKKPFNNAGQSSPGGNGKLNKIAISLSPAIKLSGESGGGAENGS